MKQIGELIGCVVGVYDQGSVDCIGTALSNVQIICFLNQGFVLNRILLICILGGSWSSTTEFVMYLNVIGLNKHFLKDNP